MSTAARLAAFAALLALAFGAAAGLGRAIGPEPVADAEEEHGEAEAGHGESEAPPPLRGLAIASGGLRILVENPDLRRGRTQRLVFRVVDENGDTVSDFDVEHEKRMHMIVVRRDFTGFQHLHPRQTVDGAWEAGVRLGSPGSYRLFADFTRDGRPFTLASDLRVDGDADLRDLPAPRSLARSDGGYDVRLDAGAPRPGEGVELRFSVMRDGNPVALEEYLGAGGHLVALREGDLAFLHVHPTEPADGEHTPRPGEPVGFEVTFPTAGRYRLFLQFQHEGRVQTVAFTQEVR